MTSSSEAGIEDSEPGGRTGSAAPADAVHLFTALRRAPEALPPALRQSILELGSSAIPDLIAILEDEDLASADSPNEGWSPIHAVDLLVELGAISAIRPMLEALRGGDGDDILSRRIAVRLPKLGPVTLEPILAELASTSDPDLRMTLCEMLAMLGVRDERIWQMLSNEFARAPVLYSSYMAEYGDERAIPMIQRAIYDFDPTGPWARLDLSDLIESYEELAGAVPDEIGDHVDALLEILDPPKPIPAVSKKVGRNDPCPCGSGQKHKRCCLK